MVPELRKSPLQPLHESKSCNTAPFHQFPLIDVLSKQCGQRFDESCRISVTILRAA